MIAEGISVGLYNQDLYFVGKALIYKHISYVYLKPSKFWFSVFPSLKLTISIESVLEFVSNRTNFGHYEVDSRETFFD